MNLSKYCYTQTIYWHFDSLWFYQEYGLSLQVEMPSVDFLGDTLTSFLTINEIDDNGVVVYSGSNSLAQELVCAFDPNDKLVFF